jgi:DNA-binding beta-propeller fold protein YncE
MNSRKFLCSSILAISVSLTVLVALSIAGQVDAVKATLTVKNKVPPVLMDAINKTQVAEEQAKNTGGNDTKIFDRLNDLRGMNESGNPEKVIGSAGAPANGFYVFIKKWGIQGSGDGQFRDPGGIAVDSSGNVYVADLSNHRIQKFTNTGTFIAKWATKEMGSVSSGYPEGIAIDSSGNVYVSDMFKGRVQKFTSTGTFITKWGSEGSGDGQFEWPIDVAVDSSGNVYVSDVVNNRIQKFTSDGTFITKLGTLGSENRQFRAPWGIALDSSGRLYVADDHNFRIQVFLWKPNVLNPIEPPIAGFK